MTVLQPKVPTLHEEDNFRLIYLGTYGKVDWDPQTNKCSITEVQGPLPKGRYLYDSRDYLGGMEEGEARLVPFNIIRIWWGDPRSVMGQFGRTKDAKGQIGDIAPREQEVRRLSVLYGVYDSGMDRLALAAPKVSITTADNVEVYCPAVDPEAEHIYGLASDDSEIHDVATQLSQMRQQIALLEQMQKAEGEKGKNDGADVEHDGPKRRT